MAPKAEKKPAEEKKSTVGDKAPAEGMGVDGEGKRKKIKKRELNNHFHL